MKNLTITVANKVATYHARDGAIVCDNSDYQITFLFDSEWTEHPVKTARFKWNGGFKDVVFVGNTVDVPKIANASKVEVGVYAGDTSTTTPAVIPCEKSIRSGSEGPVAPTADVYAQLVDLINTKLKYAQLKPEFANDVSECADPSKVYVLPDGYIYACMPGEKEEFHDVLEAVGYTPNTRINSSGAIVGVDSNLADTTLYIPCKAGDVIRINNMDIPDTYTSGKYWNIVASYDTSKTYIAQTFLALDAAGTAGFLVDAESENGNISKFTVKESVFGANVAYVVINARDITDASEVYVNSTIVTTETWANTGHAFVPADYEGRLDDIENTLAQMSSAPVPNYWLAHLAEKAETIQQSMETAGSNKSAFLWYTDAHWQTNSKRSPVILKYLAENTPMNKVNFGGDIINDPNPHNHATTKYIYEWRKLIEGLPHHHSVYGNHDVCHRDSSRPNVSTLAYAHLLAPEESSDMVVGGDSFYYIDNPAEKTRYLYLSYLAGDHGEMTAQGEFIIDAILTARAGWHIIAIAHRWWQYEHSNAPTIGSVPAYETEILKVFDEYNARTTHTKSNYFEAHDFSNAPGKVEFCIGGHIHVDHDFKTSGGIPVIITASDTNQERSSSDTEDCGTLGTTTESAVYGIIADYTSRTVHVVGVGRGGSRTVSL